MITTEHWYIPSMIWAQRCKIVFSSNLGIFWNMKRKVFSWHSIPRKAHGLRDVDAKAIKCLVMSLCPIKDMSKFHVFYLYQFSEVWAQTKVQIPYFLKQFDIYFYVDNCIMDQMTIWKKKNFDFWIFLDIMKNILALFIFFNLPQTLFYSLF